LAPKQFAQILLSRLNTNRPVDVEAVCRALRLDLQYVKSSGFNGAMLPNDRRAGGVVRIKTTVREKARERFSIAHEVGHYVMLEDFGAAICVVSDTEGSKGSDPEVERGVDAFAVELLMPEKEVSSIVGTNGVAIKTVKLIKERFNVSFRAAAYRCIELTNTPSALVIAIDGQITQYSPSSSWIYKIFTKRPLPTGTVVRRLFDNGSPLPKHALVPGRTWEAYINDDVVFREESIYHRRYGTTLSFLTEVQGTIYC
jgi:hypothetical protein